ncbi:MAG: TMEM165/GDT1 family protein [Planctomycetes bacterium]|nr:TMEM165/GDT1 family protein [Planctomycetota bacterium]
MEWWKLFSGTFVLIFLAELGDKTQLAALAKTADSPGSSMAKWIVFFGASLALVASTFIAVFLGHFLKSLIPDERYIRLAAAILFLIFGASILYEVYSSFRRDRETPAATAPATTATATDTAANAGPGLVGGLALRAAMDFESLSVDRYRRLAATAPADLAALLLDLAHEEEGHLARLRRIPEELYDACHWDGTACRIDRPTVRSVRADPKSRQVLDDLIAHENATADFYQNLAGRTLIPSVRTALLGLADEERGHAKRLGEAV